MHPWRDLHNAKEDHCTTFEGFPSTQNDIEAGDGFEWLLPRLQKFERVDSRVHPSSGSALWQAFVFRKKNVDLNLNLNLAWVDPSR